MIAVRRAGGRIRSAAEWAAAGGSEAVYEPLRPGRQIERAPPRTLDGRIHPALERERTHRHPDTFRLRLRRARLAGVDSLLLTRDRRVFEESHFDPSQLDTSPTLAARLPRAHRLRGTYMTIATPWCYGHFHWMLDTLPRLALLPLDELPDVPLIVPAELSAAQRESLARAGVEPDRTVPFEHDQVVVDDLVWPSRVGRTGNPPRWVVDWLRERLAPAPAARSRRLYASRTDAAARRAVNEDEVVALLAERGFEPVVADALPLSEQLRLFATAEIVVGIHGANLTNVFAARGATVVEVFSAEYVNACYYALADAAGHDYWYLVCEPGTENDDVLVDLERLAATVDAALAARKRDPAAS